MSTKMRRKYGLACGKHRSTGLLGKVYELNGRGEIIPTNETASGERIWVFGNGKSTLEDALRYALEEAPKRK